jgi:hypothetical protein
VGQNFYFWHFFIRIENKFTKIKEIFYKKHHETLDLIIRYKKIKFNEKKLKKVGQKIKLLVHSEG